MAVSLALAEVAKLYVFLTPPVLVVLPLPAGMCLYLCADAGTGLEQDTGEMATGERTHTHKYTHTHAHTHTHTYMHTHAHTHTYMHTHAHTHTHNYRHTKHNI